MRRVMLATPAYDARVDVTYADAMLSSVLACAERGIWLRPIWWPGEALVQHARNMLVQLAIDAQVDDVLFVDADQEWTAAQAVRLLSHDVDVVGAPVRKKNDAVEEYNVRSKRGANLPVTEKGLLVADSIGTGFLRVSKRALEMVHEGSKPYRKGTQECRMVFDVPVIGGELWGEDTVFCEKLKECGFPIHVDPTFVVAHHGAKKYTGDFQDYLKRLQGQRPTANPVEECQCSYDCLNV